MPNAYEVNFDGLVGPTHHYGGLSFGNVASYRSDSSASSPKQAAKQGLQKMKYLADRGFKQAILPPLMRPDISYLRSIGYTGDLAEIVKKVAEEDEELLSIACSASSMWTANAATVSPSADSEDGKVNFTPANLQAKLHRSIEHPQTSHHLQQIFADKNYFTHHDVLPQSDYYGDEGAANHTRFCLEYGEPGVEFFVYGKVALDHRQVKPQKYPARQSLEASKAISRLHGLSDSNVVFAQQNPEVIDAGVFHNDVIAVGDGTTLFFHEHAFLHTKEVLDEIDKKLGQAIEKIEVKNSDITVEQAVNSYLFNSQLLDMGAGKKLLLVPGECEKIPEVSRYLKRLIVEDNAIQEVKVMDLKQSMKNGGGPACLRLRVVLTDDEMSALSGRILLDNSLYDDLVYWVDQYYRDELVLQDLADPNFALENREALISFSQVIELPSLYQY